MLEEQEPKAAPKWEELGHKMPTLRHSSCSLRREFYGFMVCWKCPGTGLNDPSVFAVLGPVSLLFN